MKRIHKWTQAEVVQLGITEGLYGKDYLVFTMELMENDPTRLCCISKLIYSEISNHFKTNVACVERDIRTLINKIWEDGNRAYLEEIAGRTLDKRPSNKQFIDMLYARYIQYTYRISARSRNFSSISFMRICFIFSLFKFFVQRFYITLFLEKSDSVMPGTDIPFLGKPLIIFHFLNLF